MIRHLPAIVKATAAFRAGTLTPSELLESCLERIDQWDSRIHAWVLVDAARAREEAGRLTSEAQAGRFAGPLHGIPVGIKDIIDVAGWPTRCGSPLRRDRIAIADAPVVARLKRAGAIILGKTATTEFAGFDPPPTRNPWNLDRTPGGSSSGSAAAVASEMCLAAVGTQTGGSIIRPASYCGVVGLKPSFGALCLEGIEPLSWNLDHVGPIARTVADAAVVYQVLKGELQAVELPDGPRQLGQLGGFFEERADRQVNGCFASALDRLAAAGVSVERPANVPVEFELLLASHARIIAVDAAAHHRAAYHESQDQFGPKIRGLIAEGLSLPAVDYAEALQHQRRVRSDLEPLFAGGRVLVMPSTTTPAPDPGTTGDPAFNSIWSFAGLPAVTIPCGQSADGLPCGMQFVGGLGTEMAVLAAAARCETVLGELRPRLADRGGER